MKLTKEDFRIFENTDGDDKISCKIEYMEEILKMQEIIQALWASLDYSSYTVCRHRRGCVCLSCKKHKKIIKDRAKLLRF